MNTLETHTLTPFVGPPLPMERITSHALYRAVRWTEAAGVPTAPRRPRGAKLAGLQYERRVLDVLTAIYGSAFREQANISYWDRRGPRRAILDGVLSLGNELIIIEVKLAHTARIWEQLIDRYVPLVRALAPGATVRAVEICRSYDPHVKLPGRHEQIRSLHQAATGGLEVLRWRI